IIIVLYWALTVKWDFFFQAEDGIRDFHVTGVQTCALPISRPEVSVPVTEAARPRTFRRLPAEWFFAASFAVVGVWVYFRTPIQRSEERRVGKECRSRW